MTSENTSNVKDLVDRAWILYAEKDYPGSEAVFRQAAAADPQSVEVNYGLAMALKRQGKKTEAVQLFRLVDQLIQNNVLASDPTRATMLKRLAEAQVLMTLSE